MISLLSFFAIVGCDTVGRLAEKGLDALEDDADSGGPPAGDTAAADTGVLDTGADTAEAPSHMVVVIDDVAWVTDAISVGALGAEGLSAPVAAFVDMDIQGDLSIDEGYANETILVEILQSGATAHFWDVAGPDRIDLAGAFSEYPWGAGAGHLTWGTTHVGDDGAADSIIGITIEVGAAGEVLKTGLADAGFEKCLVRLAYGGEELLAFEEDCASVRYPIESFKQKPGGPAALDLHYALEYDGKLWGFVQYWTITDTGLVAQDYNAAILD